MPYININEIDNTQYGLSEVTNDNIVYCPINAICGTYEPTLIKSYDDLVKTYGNTGCIDDISFTYVKDIILSGFPVLCRRIRYTDVKPDDTDYPADYPELAGRARRMNPANLNYIAAKYHGTYLNDCIVNIDLVVRSVTKKVTANETSTVEQTVMNVVFRNERGAILEAASFIADGNYKGSKSSEVFKSLNTQLENYEFNYIEFSVNNYTESPAGTNTLMDGKDLSDEEGEVSEMIIKSYNETSSLYDYYLGFLNDKYLWEVKFITAGGYTAKSTDGTIDPDETAAFKGMIALCDPDLGGRGDCFAFCDIPYGVPSDDVKSHFSEKIDTTYAAAYAPWCYNKLYDGSKAWMPPSYTVLTNMAKYVSSGTPIYYPPAGVNRMKCRRTIKTEYEIGANILESWQPKLNDSQAINPIMNIRGAGYAVYGQRTLVNLVSPVIATSLKSVTVRICAIEIKKAIFNACIQLTFEQNILRTWNEFKSRVETKLLEMKKNGGLNSYQIIMDRSTISNSDINNNIARGIVRAAINDAVENFEIGFEISPSYVSFDEEQETLDATVTTDTLN